MIGIYKITEKATSYCYIGKSTDIMRRWQEHMKQGETALLNLDKFHYLLNERPENFSFEILEVCSADKLAEKEQYYLKKYNSLAIFNKISAANCYKKVTFKKIAKTQKEMVEFLNNIIGKPLFKEDKDTLVQFFSLRDKRGNLLKWTSLKSKLIENGFEIKETKRTIDGVSKNCSIISVKFKI